MAAKLCSACYVLRNLIHIVPQTTLRIIYYAHIHSILSYGIIFWGNFTNVNKLFILQKRIVRIISNIGPRDSCRQAFKKLRRYIPNTFFHWFDLPLITNTYSLTTMNYIDTRPGTAPTCTCLLLSYPNCIKDHLYQVLKLLITYLTI